MITYRSATWRDAERLTAMWTDMHVEICTREDLRLEMSNEKNFFYKLLVRLESPNWLIRVAEADSAIVGFVMGELHWPEYNDCYLLGRVHLLYVVPLMRGKGIHTELLRFGEAWAKERKADDIEFISMYEPKMIRFYELLGFEPVQVMYRRKGV